MRARFLEVNTSPHVIYTHFTCAIDTQNIGALYPRPSSLSFIGPRHLTQCRNSEFVFKAVRETILNGIINDIF
jgi:hypothetical protein